MDVHGHLFMDHSAGTSGSFVFQETSRVVLSFDIYNATADLVTSSGVSC
jgi:hypothetical protein